MNAHDAGAGAAQFVFSVIFAVLVLAGIFAGVLAIVRASRKNRPEVRVDAALLMRFALLPGERPGVVWQAASASGEPMIATITSTHAFALNFSVVQAPPVRLRPEGCMVAIGSAPMITPAATEPMVQVSLSPAGQPPVSFWIAQSGAQSLVAWARPTS